jgi:hypothetical protein
MKPKIEIDLTRPQDCKTIAEKVKFSMAVRERYEELVQSPAMAPSDLTEFWDQHPILEQFPHTHPEFCVYWARQQRAKKEILRTIKDAE